MKEFICIAYVLFFSVYAFNLISIQLMPSEASLHHSYTNNIFISTQTTPHLIFPKKRYFGGAMNKSDTNE